MQRLIAANCVVLGVIGLGCTSKQPEAASPSAPPTYAPLQTMAPSYRTFGEPAHTKDVTPTVPVSTVLASADHYEGKYLCITGTVASVCPKKGCWITLAEGGSKPMFIKFTCPVDGRLIPMEAVGKPAMVEGTVKVATISEAEARHQKQDAGASPDEIAKIVGPQTQVTVASPAARIADLPAAK